MSLKDAPKTIGLDYFLFFTILPFEEAFKFSYFLDDFVVRFPSCTLGLERFFFFRILSFFEAIEFLFFLGGFVGRFFLHSLEMGKTERFWRQQRGKRGCQTRWLRERKLVTRFDARACRETKLCSSATEETFDAISCPRDTSSGEHVFGLDLKDKSA